MAEIMSPTYLCIINVLHDISPCPFGLRVALGVGAARKGCDQNLGGDIPSMSITPVVANLSEVPHRKTLKLQVLDFLSQSNRAVKDAPRGKQLRLFTESAGHLGCTDLDCATCNQISGSALREFQWVQNSAMGYGLFVASPAARRARRERQTHYTQEFMDRKYEKDIENLSEETYFLVCEDLASRGLPVPKHKPKSAKTSGKPKSDLKH